MLETPPSETALLIGEWSDDGILRFCLRIIVLFVSDWVISVIKYQQANVAYT